MKVIYEPMGELEGSWEDLEPATEGFPQVTVYTAEGWLVDNDEVPHAGSIERDDVLHIIISEPTLTPELVAEALSKHFQIPVTDIILGG